ncbi:exocyst complex component EXO70A1-like [Oryza brachyantha]|uniref:Exocyst subunit Exo70 family protein n=1 Tax=Oryza brachyantha TaxID=4533 RepID=J3M2U7_ORYBR|nr:exocyst complex component EXO70A1-like [Oryza brachyantha]
MERAAEAAIRAKVKQLREAIHSSEAILEEAAVIGTSLSSHKAAIDGAIRPAKKRTHMACRAHDNVRRSLRAAGTILRHVDLVSEAEHVILLDRLNEDLNTYLEAVDKLRSAKYFFTSKRSCRDGNDVREHVNELLSKAVHGLENEFQRLLTKCSKPVEFEHIFNCLPSLDQQLSSQNLIGPSADGYSEAQLNQYDLCTLPTLIDPCYLTLLSKLSQKSVQLDCHQKFMEIYREIRGSTLEQSLKNLGVEYVTKEEVQHVQAQTLDAKIHHWRQSFRITVKLLFGSECMLCDQVFGRKCTWKDNCFAEVTTKSLSTLLSFGEAVVQSQTSPDKLGVLLDMYEATSELQPEVEAIFVGNACSENRKSALALIKSLSQTVKNTLGDFMEYIVNHSAMSMTVDGAVHPLTSYVTDHIKIHFKYQPLLKQIFGESCVGDRKDTDVTSQLFGVIHALETNLATKAKQYKDLSLEHLFLMNNIHYIVKSIHRLEAKDLFGADWIERQRRIVQQQATQYRRIAWLKVVESLSTQGYISLVGYSTDATQGSFSFRNIKSSATSRSVIKERFKRFNMRFEETFQTQINWDVPDRDLRETLILTIAEILLPAYRSFLKHFGPLVENSPGALKYMKYTPESLEQALGNLFAKKLRSDQATTNSDGNKHPA